MEAGIRKTLWIVVWFVLASFGSLAAAICLLLGRSETKMYGQIFFAVVMLIFLCIAAVIASIAYTNFQNARLRPRRLNAGLYNTEIPLDAEGFPIVLHDTMRERGQDAYGDLHRHPASRAYDGYHAPQQRYDDQQEEYPGEGRYYGR